jgi:arylsulfatase A-like enzyme
LINQVTTLAVQIKERNKGEESIMAERPNILFIMPDQLRADFLSCYGAPFIDTPHIDGLAERGVLYGRAYSPHPVCVPARIALMTGMDAVKNGVLDNGQMLRPDHRACGIDTWPEILSENGYYTVAVGKMHFYPWEARCGFRHRIIAEDKIWIYVEDDYHHYLRARGYRKTLGYEKEAYHRYFGAFISDIPWEHSVDRFVGQEAARWIRAYEGDEPFAMMVGFPGPHHSYDPSPAYAARFDPQDMPELIPEVEDDTLLMRGKGRRRGRKSWYTFKNEGRPTRAHYMLQRAYYAALVKQIDDEVGSIIDALREKGALENTVILFSSDHGDYLGDHNLSGKNSFYESAARVPLLARVPWAEGSTRHDGLASLSDVTATILRLAGCPIPSHMDSVPLPEIGLPDASPRERIVGSLRRGWMIVRDGWKLAKYAGGGAMLFHLQEDPTEQHNLAGDGRYADVYRRLDSELTTAIMAAIDLGHADKRVYTYTLSGSQEFGRPGWPRTYPTDIQTLE